MNASTYNLALRMRAWLASQPGAYSISLHAQERWALMLIRASSDEAVISLGQELGLAYDIRHEEGRWWCVAVGDREGGALRCEVAGPHHQGQPPSSLSTSPFSATKT